MCKEIEAVLAEGANMDPRCEVTMDGITSVSDDFVCVISKENGDVSICYNTDALTLGMAMKMVAKAFVESMHTLTEDEQHTIQEVLGGADIFDIPKED